jgi:proteasome lid subunit RPN8/RPN11
MSATVTLTRAQLEEMRRHARAALPLEACGLLVGRVVDGVSAVVAVHRGNNLRRERARFELDPLDHLAIDRAANAANLAVLGTWHSHVGGDARPSALDRANAATGWTHVILAIDTERDEVRAWRHVGSELREQVLGVLP